jgi:hypothetical protein
MPIGKMTLLCSDICISPYKGLSSSKLLACCNSLIERIVLCSYFPLWIISPILTLEPKLLREYLLHQPLLVGFKGFFLLGEEVDFLFNAF